jgi:hypothetical protein
MFLRQFLLEGWPETIITFALVVLEAGNAAPTKPKYWKTSKSNPAKLLKSRIIHLFVTIIKTSARARLLSFLYSYIIIIRWAEQIEWRIAIMYKDRVGKESVEMIADDIPV